MEEICKHIKSMRDTGDMYYLGARILEEKRKAMVVKVKQQLNLQ